MVLAPLLGNRIAVLINSLLNLPGLRWANIVFIGSSSSLHSGMPPKYIKCENCSHEFVWSRRMGVEELTCEDCGGDLMLKGGKGGKGKGKDGKGKGKGKSEEEAARKKVEEGIKKLAEKEAARKRCSRCGQPSLNEGVCHECKFNDAVEEAARKKAEEEAKRKPEVECRGCGKAGVLLCSECEMVETALFESEDTEGLVAAVGSSTDVGGVKRKAEEEATRKKAEEESKKKEKKTESQEEREKRLKYKKDKKVRRKMEKAQVKGWQAEVEAFLEDE
jgi:DNA-directed RNA polymerase subunit RPC12/RpoP